MATGLSRKKAQSTDGATEEKTTTRFDNDLFLGAAMAVLRSKKMSKHENGPTFDKMFEASMSEFHLALSVSETDPALNAIDRVNQYQEWLEDTNWTYAPPVLFTVKGFSVTVGMVGNGGSLSVTLDCEVANTIELHEAVQAAKVELQSVMSKAFKGDKLPAGQPESKPERSRDAKVEVEEYDCETLRVTSKDGKTYYYAMPVEGRWVRYGIPVYKDVLKKHGIEVPEEEGEYEINWYIEAEMKENGKPSRVSKIDEL